MPQLAAESAVAARISRSTADSELEDLVLVQTEDLRDSLTDELLLAQRDPTSMDKGTLLAQESTRGPLLNMFTPETEKYCQDAANDTKDKDGGWYWWGQWGHNKEQCWCYGTTSQTTEGWLKTSSENKSSGIACQKT